MGEKMIRDAGAARDACIGHLCNMLEADNIDERLTDILIDAIGGEEELKENE